MNQKNIDELVRKLKEEGENFEEQVSHRKRQSCEYMIKDCFLLCNLDTKESAIVLATLLREIVEKTSENPSKLLLKISKKFLDLSKEHKNETKST